MRRQTSGVFLIPVVGATAVLLAALLWRIPVAPETLGGIARGAPPATVGDDFPTPSGDWNLPKDVDLGGFPLNPDGSPAANPIKRFDDYSWKMFIAMNWPSVDGKRGVPDQTKKFGDASTPAVWDTWKAAFELFQPNGVQPSEWDSFAAASPCLDVARANGGAGKTLTSFSKGGLILEDFDQAGLMGVAAGPLVAQNQTYVRYEIHMNKTEYEFIRGDPAQPATALYLREHLKAASPLQFPFGSIELKAAWREIKLPDEKAVLNRYYHVDAMLVNPKTGQCEKKTMGLVGLHIVQKTPTRPQWIWSTFEQVDNVPPGAGAPSSFNNKTGKQNGVDGVDFDVAPAAISAAHPPDPNPAPVQVVRVNPIPDSTKKTNALYQTSNLVKGTVWKNYQLVMTQWPTTPAVPPVGRPFPAKKVGNVTMETYFQGSSCISCHQGALDTDFAFFLKLRAWPPDSASADAVRQLLIRQRGMK
jgi:hypothetical protein